MKSTTGYPNLDRLSRRTSGVRILTCQMQNSFVTANTFSFSNAVCRQHAALAMHSTGTEELKVLRI